MSFTDKGLDEAIKIATRRSMRPARSRRHRTTFHTASASCLSTNGGNMPMPAGSARRPNLVRGSRLSGERPSG